MMADEEVPPYDPVTGKNTTDMRHRLHGGEPRLNAELLAELDRRAEITGREFYRNQAAVLARYRALGYERVTGYGDGEFVTLTGPIESRQHFLRPDGRLVAVHVDELVHNSGEVTVWCELVRGR